MTSRGADIKLSPTSGWAKQAEASGKHRDCSQHRQHKHHLHHHRICRLSHFGQQHLQVTQGAGENANGAQTSQISGCTAAAKTRTPQGRGTNGLHSVKSAARSSGALAWRKERPREKRKPRRCSLHQRITAGLQAAVPAGLQQAVTAYHGHSHHHSHGN